MAGLIVVVRAEIVVALAARVLGTMAATGLLLEKKRWEKSTEETTIRMIKDVKIDGAMTEMITIADAQCRVHVLARVPSKILLLSIFLILLLNQTLCT